LISEHYQATNARTDYRLGNAKRFFSVAKIAKAGQNRKHDVRSPGLLLKLAESAKPDGPAARQLGSPAGG
jgi:hypothetical protein